MKTFEITAKSKDKMEKLLNSDSPFIILYFWKNCGHCIALKPVWKKFTQVSKISSCSVEYSNKALLPENLRDVMGFPTIQIISHGKVIDNYMGERSEEGLIEFSNKYISKKKEKGHIRK